MYRSYPGGREDRTIPVLPDFNRTASVRDAAIATKLKMHTCDRRGDTDGTRSRRDRSAAPPAHTRSHPCNCRAAGEVAGSGCAQRYAVSFVENALPLAKLLPLFSEYVYSCH